MILLIVFAFLAGIVTILSPCILPILPIILSSSVDNTGKRRPLGVVVGFVLSFTFFTLFLSTIVKLSGIPAESLRYLSIFILTLFGLSLFVPKIQIYIEQLFGKLAKFAPNAQTKHGFFGGVIIGLSLGLLWTPCVGPILASVISLALAGTVTTQAIIVTIAYSLGTAIPMFIVMQLGSTALQKVPWLLKNSAKIQKAFGVLMILTALSIFLNFDRKFQTFILDKFPNYGAGLTKLEDNSKVQSKLQEIKEAKPLDLNLNSKTAPDIIPGGLWLNLKSGQSKLSLSDLRGKVVIVDFWTYTCINCIRTLPYLKAWDEKYRDKGLVIIGVHTPEFEFEKNLKNVSKAIQDFGIKYPVIQDNDFATWNAYNNQYWPAKYFIDKNGKIRSSHFGEGKYDESEKLIQELLAETGADVANMPISNQDYKLDAKTPETYLGYARLNNLNSSQDIQKDLLTSYLAPNKLQDNKFSLNGLWTITKERAQPQTGANLSFNFESKNVYLVIRPKNQTPGKVKVFLDNQPADSSLAGNDVSGGIVSVSDDRLYTIIKLPKPDKHLLKLEFLDNNLELFAFTFG